MPKTKVEVYDKDQLIYPYVESDHVTFSNGMKVSEMLDQSISMPKVIHEDLNFKVGVGDQDVSSAIVDSSVSEMTIKGKTYQNILPEPSTHVLTNNKEMFKVNEGLDPNVEIVDGVSKSAILSGNTLVNTYKITESTPYTYKKGSSPLSKLTVNLSANKTYLILLDFSTVDKNGKEVINFFPMSVFTDGTRKQESNFNIKQSGKFTYKYTPSKDVTDYALIIGQNNFEGYNPVVIIENAMIIEYQNGMENWDIPYFEGMQSVKMPVLTTVGKNLLPPVKNTWYPCRFKQGTTFKLSTKDSVPSNGGNVVFKDINGTSVWFGIDSGNTTSTKVLPCDVYYISNSLATDVEHQLEIGKQVTSYEPYKTNILSCQLAPLNQSMFEQGTFAESTPPNTKTYQQIKLDSNNLYDTRIRTKGTYKVVQGATYEVQLNEGYGIFICYCKNGLYSATVNRWLDGTSTFTVPNDCDEMFFALRKTNNSAIAPSDYSSIGLKIHQEVVLRSLPNGVKDTLNLNTGEYVQRIKEVVFDGSSDESIGMVNVNDTTLVRFNINNVAGVQTGNTNKVLCSSLPYLYIHGLSGGSATVSQECISNHSQDANTINIVIKRSRLSSVDVAGFRAYLQSNPITIQYSIATPIVKTVDLSSSGNWEKVVLDGSEKWTNCTDLGNGYYRFQRGLGIFNNPYKDVNNMGKGFSDTIRWNAQWTDQSEGFYFDSVLVFRIHGSRLSSFSNEGFEQFLSQNPITVWYQTTTHQDSTQVKQPIFFKDGHIIQSSGTDNSLIPTLDYQAKTSNSYVMDLMKTNARYTMKAKSASGTFTIDGTSYGAGTNGTFTTPTSMTNKLLVMSNKTNEEVMILEGDVVSKIIPYFKGIKSAFEDESKIEVLSTSKNLLSPELYVKDNVANGVAVTVKDSVFTLNGTVTNYHDLAFTPNNDKINLKLEKGKRYRISLNHIKGSTNYSRGIAVKLTLDDGTIKWLGSDINASHLTMNGKISWIRMTPYEGDAFNDYTFTLQVEESPVPTSHEPHRLNATKIPLLSPLRSLPNGVCDELIIDRMKNKATLIQRVGYVMLNGSEEWNLYPTMEQDKTLLFQTKKPTVDGKNAYCVSDKYFHSPNLWSGYYNEGIQLGGGNPISRIDLRIYKGKVSSNNATILREYLSKDPIVVLYELATPIITEVDLEGFPYIYKDGHIFLNSEIVPTTEIIYSVNQCQQISASNEDIIRHEKELTYLQKLIAQYVQVDYESALLSLKV